MKNKTEMLVYACHDGLDGLKWFPEITNDNSLVWQGPKFGSWQEAVKAARAAAPFKIDHEHEHPDKCQCKNHYCPRHGLKLVQDHIAALKKKAETDPVSVTMKSLRKACDAMYAKGFEKPDGPEAELFRKAHALLSALEIRGW